MHHFGGRVPVQVTPLGVRKALLSWRGVGSCAGNSRGVRCVSPLLGDTLNTTPLGFAPLLASTDMLTRRPGDPRLVPRVGEVFGEVLLAERGPVGLRGVRARSRRGVFRPAREAAAALRAASRKPPRALFGGEAAFGGELALGGEAALSGRGGEGFLLFLGGEPAFVAAALRSSSRGTAQDCGISLWPEGYKQEGAWEWELQIAGTFNTGVSHRHMG